MNKQFPILAGIGLIILGFLALCFTVVIPMLGLGLFFWGPWRLWPLIVLGLGLTPYVRFDIACIALIGYLLVSVVVYLRTYVEDVFQLSYGRLGPTEVRVILILLNTTMFFIPARMIALPAGDLSIFDPKEGTDGRNGDGQRTALANFVEE